MSESYAEPDLRLYNILGRALRSIAVEGDLKPEDIRAGAPGVINLGGSGVAIFWTSTAYKGGPGWLVRETYKVTDLDGSSRNVTATVTEVPESEVIRAAKCALMLVLERRLDAVLNGLES